MNNCSSFQVKYSFHSLLHEGKSEGIFKKSVRDGSCFIYWKPNIIAAQRTASSLHQCGGWYWVSSSFALRSVKNENRKWMIVTNHLIHPGSFSSLQHWRRLPQHTTWGKAVNSIWSLSVKILTNHLVVFPCQCWHHSSKLVAAMLDSISIKKEGKTHIYSLPMKLFS